MRVFQLRRKELITTVFSFSPTAEEHFKAKLVDPNHEQQVYANSPAMIWDGKKFIVIMRMWLDQEHTIKKTKNVFSDNYLYTRTYNDKMEPLVSVEKYWEYPREFWRL
ncbi:hypothetical protein EB796_006807 [Bugula neritina]|uniref:Uncharacterized protein n=1 Tax=Bugula neritina TaxID=10212 RepID=A0A7J7K9L3_BUGNE|nr:hypothetical protein EB796_006807 [Bugula neritina]